jgi:DNA-binding CsgD family transcriptional regulator
MNKAKAYLVRRSREIAYVLTSLPILLALFVFAVIGLFQGSFLPLAILIFLFLLSAMQKVAEWEIKRANFMLGTDFPIAENWFGNPFFSWDGAKERVTSLRSWLALIYIFVGFFWALISFVLVVSGLAGIATVLSALGILALSNFSRSFEVIDGGDKFTGSIRFIGDQGQIRLQFGESTQDGLIIDSGSISWDLNSNLGLAIGFVLVLLALWLIPRIARTTALLVEAFLSGTLLPRVERALERFNRSTKVSEREVREAMDKESLQPALSELSKREREILALMAQGKSNSGIAKSLYITEGSVEKHISNILSKLDIKVGDENHRRVLAVLTYLGIQPGKE